MNENAKSVICDYCGEEMKLIWTACYSERKGGFFQFQCPKCLACTPRVKTQVDYYKEKPSNKELEEGREAAYDAAMKRDRAKGKWILVLEGVLSTTYRCSHCGNYFEEHSNTLNAGRGDKKYCPNCGADMREETNDDNHYHTM